MRSTGLWFKAKLYGWGWTPVSWQGWLSTFVYCVGIVTFFSLVDINNRSVSETLLWFVIPFAVFTGLFVALCYLKGEKPRWRWGK